MGRPRTNKDDEVVNLYNEGYNTAEVAKRVGYAESTVRRKLNDFGVYDPPVTKHFVSCIWGRWQETCNMLR